MLMERGDNDETIALCCLAETSLADACLEEMNRLCASHASNKESLWMDRCERCKQHAKERVSFPLPSRLPTGTYPVKY